MASRLLSKTGRPLHTLSLSLDTNSLSSLANSSKSAKFPQGQKSLYNFRIPSARAYSSSPNVNDREKTHYETLGIQPSASRMEIKAAYFRLSKRYHPDVRWSQSQNHGESDTGGGDVGIGEMKKDEEAEKRATERFHEVSKAYQVLSDDRQRYVLPHSSYNTLQ